MSSSNKGIEGSTIEPKATHESKKNTYINDNGKVMERLSETPKKALILSRNLKFKEKLKQDSFGSSFVGE